jgi:hypothetical protein
MDYKNKEQVIIKKITDADKITKINNLIKHENIIEKNKFFNDLDKIMSNKDFSEFYDKYFTTFNDIKTILLYMKLYETLKKEYFNLYNEEINKDVLAIMIKELISDTETRKLIIKSFNDYTDQTNICKNLSLLNIFDNYNKLK